MAHLIPNTYSSYALTPEEQEEGSKLTTTQKQVIQNEIAIKAEEKLNLILVRKDVDQYLQDEAYISGYLAALKYLLDVSDVYTQKDIDIETGVGIGA